MSAWAPITTPLAWVSFASSNAVSNQRRSAPVRASRAWVCAAVSLGAPYQGSVSLFEPPGTSIVANRTPDWYQRTFSTNARSVGWLRS
jgi:hypothetical protein